MPSSWRRVRVGDIGRVVTGKTPSTADSENFGGDYPFVTIPDLGISPFVSSTARTLSEQGAALVKSAKLPANAVLMSCIATVGKRGITTRPSFTNQQINSVVCGPDVKPLFLYYAFAELAKLLDSSGSGGSVFANVSKGRFADLPVLLPPLPVQEAIAAILVSLDSRIDLLRQTNATLESIAQALFKSWFIDFDPVRAKAEGREPEGMDAATAALFPAEFEESALGLIPQGWTACTVSAVASLKGGKQLERSAFDDDGPNPIFGGAGEMGRTHLSNADGFVLTVGRVGAYCGQFFWREGAAWVNNNASLVRPHSPSDCYWLHQALLASDIDRIKKGAAQPFVSNSDIEALPLILATAEVRQAFYEIAKPLYERQSITAAKASSLKALRDTLLPRLISGKLQLQETQVQGEGHWRDT